MSAKSRPFPISLAHLPTGIMPGTAMSAEKCRDGDLGLLTSTLSFSIHMNVASLRARSLKCRELIANQLTDKTVLKCIHKLASAGRVTNTDETRLGPRILVSKGLHKLLLGQTFGALCQVEMVLRKQRRSNVAL
jgi:hypothetical protein